MKVFIKEPARAHTRSRRDVAFWRLTRYIHTPRRRRRRVAVGRFLKRARARLPRWRRTLNKSSNLGNRMEFRGLSRVKNCWGTTFARYVPFSGPLSDSTSTDSGNRLRATTTGRRCALNAGSTHRRSDSKGKITGEMGRGGLADKIVCIAVQRPPHCG